MTQTTHFRVKTSDHAWLSPEGYSKYYDRLSKLRLLEDKKSPKAKTFEVYGYEQCVEHIAEYYGRQDEYTAKRQKDVLKIERVITTVDEMVYTPIKPILNGKATSTVL